MSVNRHSDIPSFRIGSHQVGKGYPVYVIAEISANHNRNLDEAIRLVRAAHMAGADAVKLQTYTPDTMTIRSDREYFRISGGTLWDGKTLHDLYDEAATPWEWHAKLKEVANDSGMELFSTAFDPTAVDFLEQLGVPVHKVASFENVDLPLIRKMARTAKPLIISTGMASLAEIEEAVFCARAAGVSQLALLKCTSDYPALPEEMHLVTIPDLAQRFCVTVGLSDHTLGTAVPIVAVSLGASIIEKHLTLSRSIPGPDSAFSLEPCEFKEMVAAIRTAEKALGSVIYEVNERESKSRVFRRSLFVVNDVMPGELFTTDNVRCIRPGHGLHPRYLDSILGSRAACRIERGTPLEWKLVSLGVDAPIVGDRVTLRPLSARDTEYVLQWRASPAVRKQLFSPRPPTRAEHESFLMSLRGGSTRKEFIIVRNADNTPIGQIGLSQIDRESCDAEFGILIGAPDCLRQGFGHEASELLLEYAFQALGLQTIRLRLFGDNVSARRLYGRLGFVADSRSGEYPKDGVIRPTLEMRLDRDEWARRRYRCLLSA
jgi:pseudaminic acid synthase